MVFVCTLLTMSSAKADTQAAPHITLLTEEHRPASWADPDGTLHGGAVDNAHELMGRANIPYDMKLLPWARAYTETIEHADTCIFGMAITDGRRGLFKWIKSFGQSEISLYVLESSALKISSLDDVRRQGLTVGVEMGDVTEVLMQEAGGLKLDSVNNRALSARKLVAGRIDLWASGPVGIQLAEKAENMHVKPLLRLAMVDIGIACNKQTDDSSIAAIQRAFDSMKKDGTLTTIWNKKD